MDAVKTFILAMNSTKKVFTFLPLLLLLIYAISCLWLPLRFLRIVCGFGLIAVIPGLAVYLALRRSALELVETTTVSLALSPVVVSVFVCLLMLSGLGWGGAIGICLAASIGIVLYFAFRGVMLESSVGNRIYVVIFAVSAFFALAAAIFPIVSEFYRMRSDAWHQAEMAFEILARGLPPREPSYGGLPPQYYWFYQLYVAILCKVTSAGPFGVMSIVSAQFLFVACLSIYLVSNLFKKKFSQNLSAVLLTIIGAGSFGYLFWLPRCFVGETRGWDEILRNLDRINEGVLGTTSFVNDPGGIPWVLAKYMHSNPMVIASVLIVILVYVLIKYLVEKKISWLVLLFISLVGVLLFHTVSAIVFLMMCGPSLVLILYFNKKLSEPISFGTILSLLAVFFLALVVTSPYLYSILWQRTELQAIQQRRGLLNMLGSPVRRLAAILASSLIVIPLAIPSIVSMYRSKSLKNVFYIIMLVCLFLYTLFGPGPYQVMRKFYFYLYVFLAVVGGWTIPVLLERYWTSRAKKLIVVLVMAVLFLPSPAILLYGWITDPVNTTVKRSQLMMAEKDKAVYRWIRENTPVDAVFIDNNDRTFILVFGERRLYQYVPDYPLAWRRDAREMEKRKHIINNIYSAGDLEPEVLKQLRSIKAPAHLVMRKDDYVEQPVVWDKPGKYPDVFEKVYDDGDSAIFRVVKSASAY